MNEFDKILDEKEKVLWHGRPQFFPFLFSNLTFLLLGIFFFSFGYIQVKTHPNLLSNADISGLLLLYALPSLGVFFFFGTFIYLAFAYRITSYAITDKRVIIQSGIIGRDFQFADFDQITNAEVQINLIDKLLGKNSGTILISTPGTFEKSKYGPVSKPYRLSSISKPYEAFKFFKKVAHDIKTDINFPNKYRPKTNPGYKTDYKNSK